MVLGAPEEVDDQHNEQDDDQGSDADVHAVPFSGNRGSVLVSALFGLVRFGFDARLVRSRFFDRDVA